MNQFPDSVLRTLKHGEMTLQGQFSWSSNYTFLVTVGRAGEGEPLAGVYKPARGERPLWDFSPASLAHRETAAYLVSEALGWHIVPPTVYRPDGPFGEGSLQLFIGHDPEHHYFRFSSEEKRELGRVVLFDLVVNNADRKGGHLIVDERGKIWLIDHGICFHEEDKMRTVIWDFAGKTIPQRLRTDVARFMEGLSGPDEMYPDLRPHLTEGEISALHRRASHWSKARRYPYPPEDRRAFPYPPV